MLLYFSQDTLKSFSAALVHILGLEGSSSFSRTPTDGYGVEHEGLSLVMSSACFWACDVCFLSHFQMQETLSLPFPNYVMESAPSFSGLYGRISTTQEGLK